MILGLSTKTLSALGAGGTLLVVAVTSAVVMADGEEFDAVQAPAWQAGYAFAYDVSGGVEYLFEVPGEGREADRMEFGPVPIEKEILSTQFDLDGKPLYVGAATFPLGHFLAQGMGFEFPDLAVYPTADRQSDLAPVGVRINDAGDSLVFGPDAPVTYLDFPLTHGKRWDSTMEVAKLFGEADALEGTDYMDLDEVLVQGEVGAMETLRLPIGEVEAVRVDISYTPIGLQKAVAQARADAEKFGADIDRLNVQLGVHETAWYAPEYQAVVKDQFIVRALVDAAGSFDGQHYEFYSEATGTALAEMTGAQLLPGAERDMPEILRYLRGEQAIAAVHGQKVPDRLYEVSVDGPDGHVNAALDVPTRFTSSLSGVAALPDGHSLRYKLVDGTGAVAKSGTAGASWSIDIDRPGSYTMVLQAVDGAGTLHAQDATPVIADWYQTLEAGCPAFTGLGVSGCDGIDLPVFAGIRSATVAAYHNGTTLAGSGQVIVDAPHEQYRGGRDGDGAYRVTIEEFDPRDLGGDWSAHYTNTAGLGGEVTYVVALVYGAVDQAPAVEADTGMLLATQDARSMGAFGAPIGSFLEQLRRGEAPGLEAELRALLD